MMAVDIFITRRNAIDLNTVETHSRMIERDDLIFRPDVTDD